MTWDFPRERCYLKTIPLLCCRGPKVYDWWPWELLGVSSSSLIRPLAMALNICQFLGHHHVSGCKFLYSAQHFKHHYSKGWGKKWFLFQRAVLNKWGEVTEFSFWGALYAAPNISTQVEGPPLQSAPCLSPPLANSPLGEWEGLPDGTHPLPLLSGGGFWKDSCALVCSHAMRALCSQDSATVGGGYCLDLPTTQ